MQSEISQKEKIKYGRLTHICRIQENGIDALNRYIEKIYRHYGYKQGNGKWKEFRDFD